MKTRFMRCWLKTMLIWAAAGLALATPVAAQTPPGVIADVSWPNCKSHAQDKYQTGIVGITCGLNFHSNPCLNQETQWFNKYAVYINTGYPGLAYGKKFQSSPRRCERSNNACLSYNYGFNAARYAIKQANLQNAHSRLWWLDVELVNSWTPDAAVNRQFLKGAEDGIRAHAFFAVIGYYSAPRQWQTITGGWHNGAPAWIATGSTKKAAATATCKQQAFTGGSMWLAQYTLKLDENVPCSSRFQKTLTEPTYNLVAGGSSRTATYKQPIYKPIYNDSYYQIYNYPLP